jgi:SAM-dependent methyltransferase
MNSNEPWNRLITVHDGPEIFGTIFKHRKQWEVEIAVQFLTRHAGLGREAVVLGVGAGKEDTIFRLTNVVGSVFATDIYETNNEWAPTHDGGNMLTRNFPPMNFSYEPDRITVAHVDATKRMPFDDNFFDGVFSSGSIEHFGGWDKIVAAASEIGRVTKPGGYVTISTEFKLAGVGQGWPGTKLFTNADIFDYIVKPSGLVLVDEPQWQKPLDDETIRTAWPLRTIIDRDEWPPVECVLIHAGYTFTSVHIAMRKPLP